MRYRGSSKIKQEHGTIKGLLKLLKSIEHWEEIRSIIPGRIKPSTNTNKLHLTVQYKTKTGVKLLAKSDGIQEVFIVSTEPDKLIERIRQL